MLDARDIANYLLDRADAAGQPMTVMTLLKVMYFAHAWYLAKNDRKLIAQPFEAWTYGPVNRVVYEQLKGQGSRPIAKRLKKFDPVAAAFVSARTHQIDSVTSAFLDNIFDCYAHMHAFKLSDLTHEKGSPWDQVWEKAETEAVPGMVIPDSLIKEWFRRGTTRRNQLQ